MTCSNCQRNHSCGCQAATASNGAACCSQCIVEYERNLNATAPQQNQVQQNNNPIGIQIQNITYQHNYT